MKRRTATVDRLLTLLLGTGLVCAGAGLIAWRRRVGFVRRWLARSDRDFYLQAPHQGWWDFALAGVAVLALLAGVWLLAANLRPNRYSTIALGNSTGHETTVVAAAQVASAVAATLARDPAITDASGIAVIDRGRPTLRFTVTADAAIPITQVRSLISVANDDIEFALGGTRIATQVFLRYLPVNTAGDAGSGPQEPDSD